MGKVMTSPMDVGGGALQVQGWWMWPRPDARPRPGARLQLLEEMQLFPMLPTGSRWFPEPLLLSGRAVVTSLAAVHTVSSAQDIFTLHNTRRLNPSPHEPHQLCCEILKALLCFFFPLPQIK